MPAAPVTLPADPVAATRRKLARLLAMGAMRAASHARGADSAEPGAMTAPRPEVQAARAGLSVPR